MADDFLETLAKHMCEAIENPGEASATEVFTICKPADMSDGEWQEWIDEIRFEKRRLYPGLTGLNPV